MSDQITEAERLDWVREARDTIRTKMRGDGLSAAQAYEATATARVWRQDDARAVLHEARVHGPEAANRERHPDFREHLHGRVRWVESVNPAQGHRLREQYDKIIWPDS